jgi:hypothetical protein
MSGTSTGVVEDRKNSSYVDMISVSVGVVAVSSAKWNE